MADDDILNPDEIESLLNTAKSGQDLDTAAKGASPFGDKPPDELASEVEASLAEALSSSIGEVGNPGDAVPFSFQDFGGGGGFGGEDDLQLQALRDVELDLRIELGRTELPIDDVLKLKEGSVVSLDKLAGDPVDIMVNGRLIGRGEVLILNDNFCVRVTEILTPDL